MSSLRSFSQIPVRTAFFVATQDFNVPTDGIIYDDGALVFQNGYPGPQIVNGSAGPVVVPNFIKGTLLKDLGRSTTVVDTAGRHLAVYREVQRVNGPDTEGVGPAGTNEDIYGIFFVRVWAADASIIYVARIG